MVFEDGYVLDDHHVNLGEDLGGHWDHDGGHLVDDVLVQAQLVEVCLEKEQQQDHQRHKQHVCQVQDDCEDGFENCLPLWHVLVVQLIRLEVTLKRPLELHTLLLELRQLSHSVILWKLAFFCLPGFDQVGGPKDVDEGVDEDEDVIEGGEFAGALGSDVALLDPEEDLDNHGEEEEGPGLDGKELHELKIEGDLLATVVSHAFSRERFEGGEAELQFLLDAHLSEVALAILAFVLRVHLVDHRAVGAVALLPLLLLEFLDVGDIGRDFDVFEHKGIMQRVVIYYVPLLQRLAKVYTVVNDLVSNDESFRGEKLGAIFEFVNFKFAP